MGQVQVSRVVVDTNVLVSGLLFGETPGAIVTCWHTGNVQPLCSKAIIEEYLRVLAYPKFRLTESEIDLILTHEILPFFEVLNVPSGKPIVAMDPADDKFIWCAIEGGAKLIVSGDDHLLKLTDSPVPVLSAADFLSSQSRR